MSNKYDMNRVFSDRRSIDVKLYLAKYRAILQRIENERRNQLKSDLEQSW